MCDARRARPTWSSSCRSTRSEQPGVYYNTAVVIDADGTYLGKYRKHHIPQVPGFWEKYYFRPGNLGYPVFDTAVGTIGVYICYDRHFPEGWRALGLDGARIVFNPSATSRGLSQYLWQARAARRGRGERVLRRRRSTASASRTLGDNDFYGSSYFVDPRGQLVGDAGSGLRGRGHRARPRHVDCSMRCAAPGPSTATAAPTATASSSSRRRARGQGGDVRTLISGRDRRQRRPDRSAPTCSSTARRIAAPRPRRARRASASWRDGADRVHRRDGQARDPGRHRRPHPHGDALRRHPVRATPSRPAPGPRRSAARRRSSTSRSSPRARACARASTPGTRRPTGKCAIDYGFHIIISDVNDVVARGDGRPRRRGRHELQALHGLPRRLLLDRRRDPPGDAARVGQRRRRS